MRSTSPSPSAQSPATRDKVFARPPLSRQCASHSTPSVRIPSTVACVSAAFTPITAHACCPCTSEPARIRRAEALLQVHRGAKAIRLPVAPAVAAPAQHHPLQHAQIAHPRRLARRRCPPVLVRQQLQRSRPRLPEPVRCQPQHPLRRSSAHHRCRSPAEQYFVPRSTPAARIAHARCSASTSPSACRTAPCRPPAPRPAHARRESFPAPPQSVRASVLLPRRFCRGELGSASSRCKSSTPLPDHPWRRQSNAAKDQLGIKLDSQKAPVDYVLVDHTEHPSAN